MELEQILKQVDWLDEERRKDKNQISSLEERFTALEDSIAPISHQINDLEGQITRLATQLSRLNTIDDSILSVRQETKQLVDDQEKLAKKREEETEKLRRTETRALENSLTELRKELEQIQEIKRSLKTRMDEESRLARLIDEVRARIETIRRSEEEYTRTIRLLDDGRRQDAKKLTDLTGESTALRKRVDDQGGKLELSTATLKKIETRINEMATVETERREAVTNFLDTQALREVERERMWKEWQVRFQVIESQTSEIENTLQSLDATNRNVKRSQQSLEELSQKVERRINEITEIQRLAEERFRQEWATFKADDQKRWTNYTLTLEEQRSETQRQHDKLAEKVIHMEDEIQEIQDLLQQMNEHTEKRLQAMLAMTHEWVTTYERTIGRTR